jgi:hypothetical protein
MFYAYLVISAALGLGSNFVAARVTFVGSVALVTAGLVLNSLPWIDWRNEVPLKVIWRIASQGVFWYLLPGVVLFVIPFIVGRYGTRLLLSILQQPRG